jgi:hypothetical protein
MDHSGQARPGRQRGFVRAGEVRAGEVRAGEVRAGEVRAGEVRAGEVRAVEVRAGEVHEVEVRAVEVRSVEDRAVEVRAIEVRAGEVRAVEARVGEARAGEDRAGKDRTGKVNRLELDIAPRIPAADHGDGRLDVGSCQSLLIWIAGIWWRPRLAGVLTDERGEDLHHGRVVFGGITGDPLEGVDAADAHVELFGSELLDGLGVAVGHLPFAGQGEVPRREQERAGGQQPGAEGEQPTPRGIPCRLH